MGTIFDDNATRNIFDPTTAGHRRTGIVRRPTSATSGLKVVALKNFLASLGGNINGTWTLADHEFQLRDPRRSAFSSSSAFSSARG